MAFIGAWRVMELPASTPRPVRWGIANNVGFRDENGADYTNKQTKQAGVREEDAPRR